MKRAGASALALLVAVFAAGAHPARGQGVRAGDLGSAEPVEAPFEPSAMRVVHAMLDMAKVGPADTVIDLGSGDGRIVIAAAERGARAFGVERDPGLVAASRRRARGAGVAGRARFAVGDLFETDLRPASVLTMYLWPEMVLKLRPKVLAEMRPGSRVVAHAYHFGAWRPDAMRLIDFGDDVERVVYLWIVPGRAAGRWRGAVRYPRYADRPVAYRVDLDQSFQDVTGTVTIDGNAVPIERGRLRGNALELSFTGPFGRRIARHEVAARIDGGRIDGSMRLSGAVRARTFAFRLTRADHP